MNPQIVRALQLMQLGRHEAAEKELRQALLADPNLAFAHSLLASCLLERKEFDAAQAEAQAAIGLEPDHPFAHYMLARVWKARGYADRAAQAVDEAIRLGPTDADFRAFRAVLYFEASQWQAALAAAEAGLQFDPEHAECNNLRAMALVKLGRKAEAGLTIDAALAREPENSWTHANKGWTLLESRQVAPALEHFREALRLEPTNDYARAGLVEALKARNPIYGFFLRYMLWMAKLPPKWQFGVIFAGYIGNNWLRGLAQNNPELAPYVMPMTYAYFAFVAFTWLAQPIFNLLLRAHPIGRHAIAPNDRIETNIFAGLLLLALGLLALSWAPGFDGAEVAALLTLALALPLHVTFQCSPGWPRWVMIGVTLLMAFLMALGSTLMVLAIGARNEAEMNASLIYFQLFGYGMLLTMSGGQLLARVTPKR